MVPFTRAKLKDENPTQFASKADVARAKREAMAHAEDLNADLARRVNAVTNRVDGLEKREPTAAATGPSYFAEIDYGSFSLVLAARQEIADLRREIVRISEARDDFRDRMYRQAETINAMQGEANSLNATAANLERERDNAREGREKAVVRCIELEKENDALRLSLIERDLRLATIRSKARYIPPMYPWNSYLISDLLEACL